MAAIVSRIVIPRTNGNLFSMGVQAAKLGCFLGTTGLFGAHFLARPTLRITQCQGKHHFRRDLRLGGVAPRQQFTQADPSLRVSRAPVDFQQLSSGSVLGMITGYLTAKLGRLFLFSFGGT